MRNSIPKKGTVSTLDLLRSHEMVIKAQICGLAVRGGFWGLGRNQKKGA